MDFDFEIIHKKGKLYSVADALSRSPVLKQGQEDPNQPTVKLL